MSHAFHADDVDVSPADVKARHEAGEIQLIDVREPYEHEAGRIAGARHIELERVASQAPTIDKDRPVVFYCRLGARSGMAANAFRRAGGTLRAGRTRVLRFWAPAGARRVTLAIKVTDAAGNAHSARRAIRLRR